MNQLKIHCILLTNNNDDDQSQPKVMLRCTVISHLLILFFNVLFLQHRAEMGIEIVEFPDSTGDK